MRLSEGGSDEKIVVGPIWVFGSIGINFVRFSAVIEKPSRMSRE